MLLRVKFPKTCTSSVKQPHSKNTNLKFLENPEILVTLIFSRDVCVYLWVFPAPTELKKKKIPENVNSSPNHSFVCVCVCVCVCLKSWHLLFWWKFTEIIFMTSIFPLMIHTHLSIRIASSVGNGVGTSVSVLLMWPDVLSHEIMYFLPRPVSVVFRFYPNNNNVTL